MKYKSSTRLQRILDLLATQPEVGVAALSARFEVTTMTIRRDLAALAAQGRVTRTHGGAMLAAPSVAKFAFQERQQTQMPAKRAIGRAAAQLVAPGMTVILDTGTTTLEVAKAIAGIPGLRVLTSSLAIASELFAHGDLELVLLGGTVSQGSPDLTGPLTEENLAGFRADLAFIGADGVNADGLYTDAQAIARVSQASIASAGRAILVADSGKFGRTAFVRFAQWQDVAGVIVDGGLDKTVRQWLGNSVGTVTEALA